MAVLFPITGFLVGLLIGFIVGVMGCCKQESVAVKNGYIKIDGTFYQLTEIEFTTDLKE